MATRKDYTIYLIVKKEDCLHYYDMKDLGFKMTDESIFVSLEEIDSYTTNFKNNSELQKDLIAKGKVREIEELEGLKLYSAHVIVKKTKQGLEKVNGTLFGNDMEIINNSTEKKSKYNNSKIQKEDLYLENPIIKSHLQFKYDKFYTNALLEKNKTKTNIHPFDRMIKNIKNHYEFGSLENYYKEYEDLFLLSVNSYKEHREYLILMKEIEEYNNKPEDKKKKDEILNLINNPITYNSIEDYAIHIKQTPEYNKYLETNNFSDFEKTVNKF